MWKRIALALVIVLIVLLGGGLAFLYLRKPAQVAAANIRVQATAERIDLGKYLFESVADCGGCHSSRDYSKVGGPEIAGQRGAGTVLSDFMIGMPGTIVAPNITPDQETGIGSWSDGEKIRAIRDGVDKDGNALFPMMPYDSYRALSDDDVQALVAYLNTLPAIRNPLPKTRMKFMVNLMIKFAPRPAGSVVPPNPSDRLSYGKYLAMVGGCQSCHTPTNKGQPLPGMDYAGGQRFPTKAGTVVTANITPDLDTGIGKWSEDFFLNKFDEYKGYAAHGSPPLPGPQSFTMMPWLSFAKMQPGDLRAIYAYLRTIPPVRHYVERHPGA